MKRLAKESLFRVLDANLNRVSEGLRVCEEVTRFIMNERGLTAELKNMRHKVCNIFDSLGRENLIKKRNIQNDVGRGLLKGEFRRNNYRDVFFSNIQRVKESMRVLEEFCKLLDKDIAYKLRAMRYRTYGIEKGFTLKISALSDIR